MAVKDNPKHAETEVLLSVGDHLELVAQLIASQARDAAAREGGGRGLDAAAAAALLAALSRSSAALEDDGPRLPYRSLWATHIKGAEGEAAAGRRVAAGPSPRPPSARRGGGASEGAADCRPPPQLIRGDDPTTPEAEEPTEPLSPAGFGSAGSAGSLPAESARTSLSGRLSGAPGMRRCDTHLSLISFFGEEWSRWRLNHNFGFVLKMERAMESRWMECFTSALIAIHTTFLILEGQYKGARIGNQLGVYSYYGSVAFFEGTGVLSVDDFVTIDVIFFAVFAVELLLRLALLRMDFLRDPWGWLDIAIVLATGTYTFVFQGVGDSVPVTTLRVLRLARLLRIVRLTRSVTAFDSIYLMTTALRGSVATLVWVIIFLFLLQTLFALVLTNIVQDFYLTSSDDGDEFFQTALEKEQAYIYFGTYWRAMVSLFELMLANWPPICRMMMETMHETWSVFAVGYKMVMGVAVVGVIFGIFTQETFRAAETDDRLMLRRKAQQAKIHSRKLKAFFDKMSKKTYDNHIDFAMFQKVLKNTDMKLWLKAMEYDVDDASALFCLIDKDGDGTLSVDELVEGMALLRGNARNIDVKLLMRQSRVGVMQRAKRKERLTTAAALKMVEESRASRWAESASGSDFSP